MVVLVCCFLYMQASPPISAGPFVEDIIESSYLSQIIDVFYIPISNLDVTGPTIAANHRWIYKSVGFKTFRGHPLEDPFITQVGRNDLPSVDGRIPAPVEVGSLSHYLQGFMHARWCRICSINSSLGSKIPWIVEKVSKKDIIWPRWTMLVQKVYGITCFKPIWVNSRNSPK